jgi:hypothetical protein
MRKRERCGLGYIGRLERLALLGKGKDDDPLLLFHISFELRRRMDQTTELPAPDDQRKSGRVTL